MYVAVNVLILVCIALAGVFVGFQLSHGTDGKGKEGGNLYVVDVGDETEYVLQLYTEVSDSMQDGDWLLIKVNYCNSAK